MLTRPVVQQFGAHGQPQENVQVVFTLVNLGYSSLVIYPRIAVTATSDADGWTRAELWPNAESLARTEYEASMPDGSKHRFVLPVGESEISLIALIEARRLGPYGWTTADVNTVIDARMDLESALRIAGDATSAALVALEAAIRAQQIADIQAMVFHASGVLYLFLDLISTTDPAPLTDPKPATVGYWDVNDGEGIISDLDGRRVFATPATPTSFVEHVTWTQESFARTPGRVLIFRITPADATHSFRLGWDTGGKDTGRTPRTHALYIHETGTVRIVEESESLTGFSTYIGDETYLFAIMQRARGAHYFMAPIETPNTFERLFTTSEFASGPLYGFASNFNANFAIEGLAESRDLAAPFDEDEADALQYIAAASPGTYACSDDGIIEIEWTAQAGTTLEISPRYTDADNRLVFRCIVDTDSIALVDRILGVETAPIAANTKTFNWVPGTQYTLRLRMEAGTMQLFVEKILIMAPSYNTHIGMDDLHLNHAVDSLVFWPIHEITFPSESRFVRQRNEFWVDSITGSDTENTGAAVDVPLRSLAAAAGRASGSADLIIHINAPVATNPLREDLNWTSSRNISLVATDPDEPWGLFVSQQHTAGWVSLGGGIYSKYMPEFFTENLQNVIVTSLTDANGFELRLDYPVGLGGAGTTPAEGESGWISATSMCYVHLPGGVDPNIHTIETAIANTGIQLSSDATMTLEDGEIRYPNIYGIALSGAGTIVGTRMVSSYGMTGNFATFNGSTGIMALTLCEGVRADNDIYNIHGAATVTLLNCTGNDADDEIASAHDDTIMTIQGGRYYRAGQGGITSVDNAVQNVYDATVDHNNRNGHITNFGGISWFDATTSGEGKRNTITDNDGPGIFVRTGAAVTLGTGVDVNTSGVGFGNTDPDNLAG